VTLDTVLPRGVDLGGRGAAFCSVEPKAATPGGAPLIDTKPSTTTDSGIRAPSDEFSLTVGPTEPTMLHDGYMVEARTLSGDVRTDPDRERPPCLHFGGRAGRGPRQPRPMEG
jgi:hypothetical protein